MGVHKLNIVYLINFVWIKLNLIMNTNNAIDDIDLQEFGSCDVGEDIAKLYMTHAPDYLNLLEESFKQDDLQSLEDHTHKLASVMGIMGFANLSTLLRQIEREELVDISVEDAVAIASKRSRATFDLVREYLAGRT